ncbi:MAG: prolipoprotein diacylglyceryl transferase [Dehalococcoidia bacterium]|nr:prolipoprotein diacylglyceryl transferase [Dehalococcoidia bacterium]MDW8119054.1 prolipoprotein diacylglyceryl transferase [Chloroflexota bacterium]
MVTLDALQSALWVVFAFVGYWLVDYWARREGERWGVPRRWLEWPLAIGALLGARLGHILLTRPATLLDPLSLLRLSDGMSLYGALAGGGVVLLLWGRKRPQWALALASGYGLFLPFGIALVHLPCPLYGSCGGQITTNPLGLLLPGSAVARWPSDLYEGLGSVLLGGVLLAVSARPQPAGRLAGLFLVCYAVLDAWLAPTRIGGASPAWAGPAAALGAAAVGLALLASTIFPRKETHAARPDGHPSVSGV